MKENVSLSILKRYGVMKVSEPNTTEQLTQGGVSSFWVSQKTRKVPLNISNSPHKDILHYTSQHPTIISCLSVTVQPTTVKNYT